MANYNDLTPAQTERLAILMEECGEVIQIVGKILRHGYDEFHPDDEEQISNREHLMKEIGDIYAAVLMLGAKADVSLDSIQYFQIEKTRRICAYTHHQDED